MATQYSNKPIVTNGLVYALDFGNQKSYVSGSSSAFNLVYSTTTSSLNSYNSGQKGVVIDNTYQFTLVTPSLSSSYFLTQALTFLDTASEYTVTAVVEPKVGDYAGEPRYLASNLTAVGRTWAIGYGTSGFTEHGFTGIYNRRYPIGTARQFVTYRYKSGSFDFFVNGIPISASGGTYSSFYRAQNGGGFSIGSSFGYFSPEPDSYAFSGSLGLMYIYNRSLSSNEIYSNYLIAAQRYGLPTPAKPYSLDENAYLFLQTAGITDPIITSSINTFVLGLKSASLWDKMIAIYPFVGTGSAGVNLTGSHKWNLKEPSLVTYPLLFTGSWNGSVSGSTPSGSNTAINTTVTPSTYYPNYSTSSAHISILSYDTPTTSSYLMGTEGTINTSSFSIYFNSGSDSGSITGSINNEPLYGIASSGPLGFITVSRTGSNSLTLARNGVTSSFSVPASGALSTNLYLGAINNNGLALGSSPYNISFASVGVGLTGTDLYNFNRLTYNLQSNLKRQDPDATAFILAANITDVTQSLALNTLVFDLKAYGVWDKIKAVYPFVGGTSGSHKYNLKDARDLDTAFRLDFSGSWTHSNTGVRKTGTALANTFLNNATHLSLNGGSFGLYLNSFTSERIPVLLASGSRYVGTYVVFRFDGVTDSGEAEAVWNANFGGSATPSNRLFQTKGLYQVYRNNSTQVNLIANTTLATFAQNSTTLVNGEFKLGGVSTNGVYTSDAMVNEARFFYVGGSITNQDALNINTAVQRFQTTLGRQV